MTHHSSRRHPAPHVTSLAAAVLVLATGPASAQPQQRVSPPEVQAWIDLATVSGLGIPGMPALGAGGPGGSGGGGAMSMLGNLLGGAMGRGNRFGNTAGMAGGRWMDVTLALRGQPLPEAQMGVPQASGLAPTLQLVSPKAAPPAPAREDDAVEPPAETERPRGKVSLYWGCGDTVRSGQPRTVDLSRGIGPEVAEIFNGRRATQRGAHSAAGRPQWPNEQDTRRLPDGASMAGELGFSGAGVPPDFRFQLPAANDLMPAVALRQTQADGATRLEWAALPAARGYFVAAMGAKAGEEAHIVLWTSSELPDSGFGLVDYQTNPAVDRWLRDKVLLAPAATTCTVPRGVFAQQGAMLRFIAYGNELNLAHPPRPTDPRQAWEPKWAVKVRLKSVAQAMLGLDMGGADAGSAPPAESGAEPRAEPAKPPSALDRLRNILGR